MSTIIKTWQEHRADGNSIEASMLLEIADIRAALARAPLPAQADGQAVDDARFDSHILLWLCDEAWFQDEIGHRLDLPGTDETVEETVRDLRKLFARMFRDSAAQSRAQSDTTGESNA